MPRVTDGHEVRTADGWRLAVQRLPATGARKGVAVLGHAMMVDRRSMDRPAGAGLASTLAARGWDVHLADVRGHGASGPLPSEGGTWTYDDLVRFDIPALVADARQRAAGGPVVLVGHSLCGHVSMATAAGGHHTVAPPDAHVLFATNTWMKGLDPARDAARTRQVLLFRAITRLFGRFPSRLLRMGPADEAGPYVRDICRYHTSGRWMSRGGVDWYAGLPRVEGPILALVGRGDTLMAHPENVERWMSALVSAAWELRVLGEGDLGLPQDPGHMELVTDPGSRGVWESVADWMEGATATLRNAW